MMVVVGSRFGGGNDEDEEIGSHTYHGEGEEEGEEEEIESDEGSKKDNTFVEVCGKAWGSERAKINSALGKFTNDWSLYGVSIISNGWTNVKGKPLINILGVSASGAVFLSAHDYSNRYKTGINIAEPLLDTIQMIGPYNVIQVIIDNAANCKAIGAIIEDKYPNIFWSGCLVHTLNLFDA